MINLGGRARRADGLYKANLGPHAIYRGGALWNWLSERDLMPPPEPNPWLTGYRLHYEGAIHRTPPMTLIPPGLRLGGRLAPVDQDSAPGSPDHSDPRTAEMLSCAAGVYTFHHDPGELSAAFVWERSQRLLLSASPPARFIVGGWSSLIDALERRARSLGVKIMTGERVDALPGGPVVVALELSNARELLNDQSLRWLSGATVCLDLGLRADGGDPWIISDLASSGWAERYNAQDASLAPAGERLFQAQMPSPPRRERGSGCNPPGADA